MCRRLGAEASYLGCLGDDAGGEILLEALTAEDVDVSRVRRLSGANARARIAHENGDRRFVGSIPGVRGRYDLEDDDFAFVASHDLTHTTINSDLDSVLPRIASSARRLSYDFSEKWTPEHLARTLPLIDFAFLSAPRRSIGECEELRSRCLELGASTLAITRGSEGALVGSRDQRWQQRAAPVHVIDSLGAGDGFIAGFLLAQLAGASLSNSTAAGAGYAAKVCTWLGAFGHGRDGLSDVANDGELPSSAPHSCRPRLILTQGRVLPHRPDDQRGVAVGTRIAPRPPRRSRRAAFPHRALVSGRT